MESPIKEGILHTQQQKFGKVWKKNWSVLYSASSSSTARLEQFDAKDFSNALDRYNPKRLERIIRLADCISISQNRVENSPKEMSTFSIITTEKTYIMAASKYDLLDWIKCLCELAFQNTSARKQNENLSASSGTLPSDSLIMEENELYSTIPQAVNQFTVMVQKTEAATRCELHGTYLLIAGKDSLILKDPKTKQDVYKWPYQYLRRYGMDQTTLTFEAGRRCDSGEGLFLFNTKGVREIFHIIEAAVKEKESDKIQRNLSLISVGCQSSTAFSRQLPNAMTSSQESLDEKTSGGMMPVSKNAQVTEMNPKITKIVKPQDWKGQAALGGVVPSAATGGERKVPTTNEREGANVPIHVIYATVKHSKRKSTKDKVEESTVNSTKYRDSCSDDCSTDPVYENVSDFETQLSFEEEPSFLKDRKGSKYQDSAESNEDQNVPFPKSVSVPYYENIRSEWSQQTIQDDHVEMGPVNKETELHQTLPGSKNKQRDISLNPGASKVTKAKFPAGIKEFLDDLYSKELSKTRESKLERAGRTSELEKKCE
ncbi:docking protein 3-like isoform X2 [Carcharodon carcharias]|uniref:docking protein 3-like isoform X2 n=1 Tax=Carcharodon carcharias TaxID=13397 RepID=UPI001B7E1918|nr:docking protein 3-like isoform X2 [Carcharodon carcharias]